MSTRKFMILQSDTPPRERAFARAGLEPGFSTLAVRGPTYARVESHELTEREAESLLDDPAVFAATPEMPVALVEPASREVEGFDGTGPGTAWGVGAVGADRSPYSGDGVAVAVLDTGIDRSHPAFQDDSLEIIEEDFTDTGNGDTNAHGTHCAGTIFGRDVRGVRIGVARGVRRALIGKVIAPGSTTDTVIRAMEWAATKGAHIVSMSLGIDFVRHLENVSREWEEADSGTVFSRVLVDYRRTIEFFDAYLALTLARSAGAGQPPLIVAATGNSSMLSASPQRIVSCLPPASADQILAIGAVQRGGDDGSYSIAEFSNARPAVVGPGVGILSAVPGGGLGRMSGTSMATPHAAGVAALWAQWQLENKGSIHAGELEARLVGRAQTLPETSRSIVGAGLVQAPGSS